MMRFEWADVNPDDQATIHNDASLAEYSEDEIEPGTVGVSMDTGSNGVMLWGNPEDLAAWAEDLARRLRAGEGKSGYGEAREFVFADRFHLVRDADGDTYEARQLAPYHQLRDNSGAPGDDDEQYPELEGDTWQVMAPGATGVAQDGRVGFVVPTRKVVD